MRINLEHYLIKEISNQKRGAASALLKLLLRLLSWPFKLGVMGRNWLFDQGWLRQYSPPVPVVISIGNIVAGGTGKTPATLLIIQEFYEACLIAVLSRGYRSKCEKLSSPTILSQGEGPKRSAEFCGDEPYLIAARFPKACVIVGKDRQKASDMAVKMGAQLLLLDDGMQHRRLARDFELVVMDGGDLFGQGYFLPRGLLREGASSLMRADLILVNHVHSRASFEEARHKLMQHTQAPIIGACVQVELIERIDSTAAPQLPAPVPSLKDLKVGLFCGIACPHQFHKTVEEQGAVVVQHATLPDHRGMERKALHTFAERCKQQGAQLLLCTEKDRVKLPEMEPLPLPLASVKTRLAIVEGIPEWQAFIAQVKAQLI